MTTNSQNDLERQVNAAFEVFMQDYETKVPLVTDPFMPPELKKAMRDTIKYVFSAGFSSAYASYILSRFADGKGANEP